LDDLLENAVPLRVGLRYMTYRMPQFVIYVLPISLLLSTFITIGLLGRSNQLTAMKASGISGYFISRPLLSLAVALSFFLLSGLRSWCLPRIGPPQRSGRSR
jgi:lipopolysaccharide export system permease protein